MGRRVEATNLIPERNPSLRNSPDSLSYLGEKLEVEFGVRARSPLRCAGVAEKQAPNSILP